MSYGPSYSVIHTIKLSDFFVFSSVFLVSDKAYSVKAFWNRDLGATLLGIFRVITRFPGENPPDAGFFPLTK